MLGLPTPAVIGGIVALSLAALGFAYWQGVWDQKDAQVLENLKEYRDVRNRADDAAEAFDRTGDLTDDELNRRLRDAGAFRNR